MCETGLSSSRSSKRARSEDARVDQRERHEFLWFNDGTVVLATETTLFRVYQGILSHHSTVFRDMFSMPQSSEVEQESIDGVPLLHLQDDATELAHLLRAIHDTEYYCHFLPYSYNMIGAILRLSNKYQIESFRRKAITHMQSFYTDSLQLFVNPKDLILERNCVDILSLARESKASILLPVAYYAVLESLRNIRCDQGMLPVRQYFRQFPIDDAAIFFTARDALRQALYNTITGSLMAIRFIPEAHSISCKLAYIKSMNPNMWNIVESGCIFKPTMVSSVAYAMAFSCQHCEARFKMKLSEGVQTIWNKLPSYFGLPDWETLRRESGLEGHAIAVDLHDS